MHCAAYQRHLDIANLLIEKNASINAKDKNGNTSLHLAVRRGNLEIVNFLIKNKAVIDGKNKLGSKPIDLANGGYHKAIEGTLRNKRQQLLEKFLKLAKNYPTISDLLPPLNDFSNTDLSNVKISNDDTLLHRAAQINDPKRLKKIVKILIRIGLDINVKNILGDTPLHLAAEKGCIKMVKLLIKLGANINSGMEEEWETPLHYAAKNGYIKVVKLLINQGANILAKNGYGETPLCLARYDDEKHIEVVEFLEQEQKKEVRE